MPSRSARLPATLLAAFLIAGLLGAASPAAADWIRNDILLGNGQSSIAPGQTLVVLYYVEATGNDKQAGCNAADSTPLTLDVLPDAPGASASPSRLTFTACAAPQAVTFTGHAVGNYRIDVRATDAGPGTYGVGGATFTLHVAAPSDATAPTWSVTAPGGAEATGPGGAIVHYEATASDPSGIASSSCSPPSGSLFPLGATTVTCTATDAAGNAAETSFDVIVGDTTPPQIGAAADASAEAAGPGGATVWYSPPTWTDAVDGSGGASCFPAPGAMFPLGATTVTCTAADAAGNAAEPVSFTVTVSDTTAPSLSLPADIEAEATGPAGAEIAYEASATDAVGVAAFGCIPPPGTFALGATTVLCTASDAAGNEASAGFTVTVVDTTPPTLHLPADAAREGDTLGGALVSWSAWAEDLVDGVLAVACSAPSGALFPVGVTEVSCSATDARGNTATGGFRVTVTDTTPPALAPLASLSLDATSGSGANASWTATAWDVVDGAVPVECSRASGSHFALGTTVVTCTATDASGNAAGASFTVSVLMRCDGPLSPFKEGKTLFRHGATIPVKCKPSGGSVGVGDATIRLTLRQVNGAAQTGDVTAGSTSAADTGNVMRWDATAQQYVYNLATKDLTRGLWELTLDFGGGHTRTLKVGLR